RRPTSCEVVTSMPRRRRPSAMAGSQHSSRWKRIVRAIRGLPGPKEVLELGLRRLRLQLLDEAFAFLDVGVDFGLVVVVVRKCRMDLGGARGGHSDLPQQDG